MNEPDRWSAPLEEALVGLLLAGLNDNVRIMRHEDTAHVLARAAAYRFQLGLRAVFEAGVAAQKEGVDLDRAAFEAFVKATNSAYPQGHDYALDEEFDDALILADNAAEEAWEHIKSTLQADRTEREAAGPDAVLLRTLGREYRQRQEEAVDAERAERAAAMAERLEELATRLDLRASDSGLVRIWRFTDAPLHLQELSIHGGDEDWIAHVPHGFDDGYGSWELVGRGLGAAKVFRYPQGDGSTVYIGSHS